MRAGQVQRPTEGGTLSPDRRGGREGAHLGVFRAEPAEAALHRTRTREGRASRRRTSADALRRRPPHRLPAALRAARCQGPVGRGLPAHPLRHPRDAKDFPRPPGRSTQSPPSEGWFRPQRQPQGRLAGGAHGAGGPPRAPERPPVRPLRGQGCGPGRGHGRRNCLLGAPAALVLSSLPAVARDSPSLCHACPQKPKRCPNLMTNVRSLTSMTIRQTHVKVANQPPTCWKMQRLGNVLEMSSLISSRLASLSAAENPASVERGRVVTPLRGCARHHPRRGGFTAERPGKRSRPTRPGPRSSGASVQLLPSRAGVRCSPSGGQLTPPLSLLLPPPHFLPQGQGAAGSLPQAATLKASPNTAALAPTPQRATAAWRRLCCCLLRARPRWCDCPQP